MKRGLFIVLDGIDGSGKSTQIGLLSQFLFLGFKKSHVFLTREPFISPHYQQIRDLLKSGVDPKENGEKFLELFVADRRFHAEVITKQLEQGFHVICDRYKYSTLVYQSAQGLPIEKVLAAHEGLLVPDLTVILDLSAKEALGRIQVDDERTHAEFFEKEEFLKELREGYKNLPKLLPTENIVILDATRDPRITAEDIKKLTKKLL